MRRADQGGISFISMAAGALVVTVGVSGLLALHSVEADHVRLQALTARGVQLERLRAAFERKVAETRGFVIAGEPAHAEVATRAHTDIAEIVRVLEADPAGDSRRDLVARFVRAEADHEAVRVQVLAIARDPTATAPLLVELAQRRATVDARLASLDADQGAYFARLLRTTATAVGRTRWGLVSLIGLALAAVAAAAMHDRGARRRERHLLERWQEFLAMASHDLKGPLTAMRLRLDLLRHQQCASSECSTALGGGLAGLERQVERMVVLIRRNLDVSRLELGGLALEREEVDLPALVREVADRARAEQPDAGDVVISTPAALGGRWDRVRLDEIVSNLLSNALKHGAGRPVELTVDGTDRTARLVVRDHGPGIPASDQARVFERYVRLPGEEHGGHGLGLWITRELVAAHGGSVRLESAPGQGATFTVELPRAQSGETRLSRLIPRPRGARGAA